MAAPVQNIKIVQVYRVTREITISVEADTLEAAIDQQEATEAPDFNNPAWRSNWRLATESIEPASPIVVRL